nr:protein ACCELERATED CELL DEATH 6 [Ipomoea batatas]
MAAPRALTGWTGVRKIMMDETITEIRFMVFPILKVKGEISSRDIDPQSPRDEHYQRPSREGERGGQPGKRRHYGDSASLDGDDTKKRRDGDSASLDGDDMMVPRRRRGRAWESGTLG